MKSLLFIGILLALFSCQKDSIPYARLTIQQCDSLLNKTALSSRERAKIVLQYVRLHTRGKGPLGSMTSNTQDICLNRLREVLHIAPADLQTELKLALLPLYLSKLNQYDFTTNRHVHTLMSELENSSLTPNQSAWYLNYKAQFYTIQRSPEEAFRLCEQARKKFRLTADKQGEFNSLSQMALLYHIQKEYAIALRYCDSASNIPDFVLSPLEKQKLYNHYSTLYANIGAYDKAIEARQKSGSDTIHNSILANLYIANGQYKEALNIIKQQKQILQDNPYRQNYYIRSMAEVYEAAGEFEKAASLREEAIRLAEENSREIRKRYPHLPGIPLSFAPIYATQAQWNWKKGKKQQAINLLRKAEMLTLRSNKVKEENIQLMDSLTSYYAQMGDYHSAFKTHIRRDSLEKMYVQEKVGTDYESILNKQEVEILNATIDKQKTEQFSKRFSHTLLIISSCLLSACIVLITVCYRLKKR